jgi:hypothetical protein
VAAKSLRGTGLNAASQNQRMKNWAIYRYEGNGKLRYLGVVSAAGQEDAMSKAVKLLPDEDPEKLCARLWEGEQA